MRKGDFEKTFRWFEANMNLSLEILDESSDWPRVGKISIQASAVLKVVADWEVLVETLMVDCLNRDSSTYSETMGLALPTDLPWGTCRAIIQGLGYFSFGTMDDLVGKSRRTLDAKWNPFVAIPRGARRKLDEFLAFRNYLAHYSSLARLRVDRIYKRTYRLKRFTEPGAFLMARPSRSGKPRYADYFAAFEEAVSAMDEALE